MAEETAWKRTIVRHAADDALAPKTDAILRRLGYRLIAPEALDGLRDETPGLRSDLLLVDERRLDDVLAAQDADAAPSPPIVLLTGARGVDAADARVVGAVKRPAGMHDLYRLLQQIFEDTPRSSPRVATQLRARCGLGDRNWEGRLLVLSENGCLIRTTEAIALGQRIQLEFSLPTSGALRLEAEAAYQLLPDVGLVFSAVAPAHRRRLERFVTRTILAD